MSDYVQVFEYIFAGKNSILRIFRVTFWVKNLFQLLIQVIMIAGAASFVSECGRGWMSLVLRGEREEATV